MVINNRTGNLCKVIELELKGESGRMTFGMDGHATGYDRARAYLARPLNKDHDVRLYGMPFGVIEGRIGQVGGRKMVYSVDFHTEQAMAKALDTAEQCEGVRETAIHLADDGVVKVLDFTNTNMAYDRLWGRSLGKDWNIKDKEIWRLSLPDIKKLGDIVKALVGRKGAKYKEPGKAWEMVVYDALRALQETNDLIEEVYYVGSLEDQKKHNLIQACDILVYIRQA